MTKKWFVMALVAIVAQAGFAKTAGLFFGGRDTITPGMIKTLEEAGWAHTNVTSRDLESTNKLAGVDVLLFTGGWNSYFFPNAAATRVLHGFVAEGKGILASGFRSGYSRTASRPLFPQVALSYNRAVGSLVVPVGGSPLAKAIRAPFFSSGSVDHNPLLVGPEGNVFARCAGDDVGAYGEIYGGRYIALGTLIGANASTNGMTGADRDSFLVMMNWLASAPKRSGADVARAKAQAELDLLRRERRWDWTFDDRGPDGAPGIVPSAHHTIAGVLESRLFHLEYLGTFFDRMPAESASVMAELKTALADLDAATKRKTAEVEAKIAGMSAADLDAWKTKRAAELETVKAALLPTNRVAALRGKADQAIGVLQAKVDKVKEERLAKERQADAAKVTGLGKTLAQGGVEARRQAALELARIGAPACAPVLIAALKDADESVRVNAILGLGWMQSKEAVPALIDLAKGSDVRMKRRAAQALGQIGDARAIPALMASLKDADPIVVQNAIFALGWLKAKEAVPELIRFATAPAANDWRKAEWRPAAFRALGWIGDDRALAGLEKEIASSNAAALQMAAAIGDAKLRARPAGIAQPAFLASADKFYALTKRFNALGGRPGTGTGLFKDDPLAYLAYLREAGFTGIHLDHGRMLWGDPEKALPTLRRCAELDLILVDTWPAMGPHLAIDKVMGDRMAERYGNEPAFAGLWYEEVYPQPDVTMADFEAWYKTAYTGDPRQRFGYTDEKSFAELIRNFSNANRWKDIGPEARKNNPIAEALECRAWKILEDWRESQEWLSGLRKACGLTWSESHRLINCLAAGMTPFGGDAIAVNGPEAYQSFGRDNAFMMECYKDGRARPVMCEYYNWYTPSDAHAVRGFAQHLMHGECFYNFHLAHIFKYAGGGYNWTWSPGRWELARRIFQKAWKVREYLQVPESSANVAQLCSERSGAAYSVNIMAGCRWYQQQAALFTALGQSQIPADVIWAESLNAEKLARYKVIVTLDNKLLTDGQAELLRDWVRQGGVLIAGGTVSLMDAVEVPRSDYRLADVFGVSYGGFAGVTDPAKNDTLRFRPGPVLPAPVESVMTLPAVIDHIHREIKPVKSIGLYTVKANAALPGMAVGAGCEYDMPLGYDKVKPAEGSEVLAAFANGDPAVTFHPFGKGACYFWTPLYPALAYVASDFENDANRKDFWPNVREILAAMVKGGLAQAQATLPVDVTGVTKEVEVTLRQQPEQNRMMVHLLDYDTKSAGVKGAVLTVYPPAGKTVKRMYYPDTDTEVKFAADAGGVTAKLRDFDVHDMVVIEWQTEE